MVEALAYFKFLRGRAFPEDAKPPYVTSFVTD